MSKEPFYKRQEPSFHAINEDAIAACTVWCKNINSAGIHSLACTGHKVSYLYNIELLICWGQYDMDIVPFHEFTHILTFLANDWTVKIKGNINLKLRNSYIW
jgi:hypothetical protein